MRRNVVPKRICGAIEDVDPAGFYAKLCSALQERRHQADFRERWSGLSGRTRILLGDGQSRDDAILVRVLRECGVPIVEKDVHKDLSFERYGDLIYFCDGWHEGRSHPEFHIEVENDLNELKGTISDLLFVQSHFRIAIFFGDLENGPRTWIDVLREYPFEQDEACRYMIITLPMRVEEGFPLGATAYWARAGHAVNEQCWTRCDWP